MLAKTTILFFVCVAAASARDASYAAELQVPIRENLIVQRLVSLGWLRYLNPSEPQLPKKVWFSVKSLPDKWQGEEVTDETRDSVRKEILNIAEDVMRDYMKRVFYLKDDQIDIQEGFDPRKTTVNFFPNSFRYSLQRVPFNRTIVITFENPPYGQSKSQRLVTNKNLDWHDDETKRFDRTENFTKIDTTDLRYRYYHNLGHSLGFGHFVSILDKNETDTNQLFKSVMFADVKNERASQNLTDFDIFSMYYIVRNLDRLLFDFSNRLLTREIPENMVRLNNEYGRFLLS